MIPIFVTYREDGMKVGYPQAAWRLFQVTLTPAAPVPPKVTWAETELAGTPFQSARLPLPVVRPKGTH
ncbi:MAG TPA: hypothetical protein VMR21_15540 [Vicinamibacteria bacterium]|nr:hypothetical protein [Vicinamibacteria bacterium]